MLASDILPGTLDIRRRKNSEKYNLKPSILYEENCYACEKTQSFRFISTLKTDLQSALSVTAGYIPAKRLQEIVELRGSVISKIQQRKNKANKYSKNKKLCEKLMSASKCEGSKVT